ncbi:MAG: hypothetical protein KGJ09_01530 [Candidatus Omnitrophica bacterium]|nr:hypothetical protein [Candidatus Omnitrophota bacterium]MDE2008738.1 hypothetical protein [Candidatus Omnitrophota bacterium]MDE2215162.1 hypothetical protein [Candidatus Omnitrophota bacterium]MDE2232165.1 hypothetical protein [Candidatus Omnitrophota bacterium]
MYLKLSLIFCLLLASATTVRAQDDIQGNIQDNSMDMQNASVGAAVHATGNVPHKPPAKIMVETNVVQIILNDEHRSGIDWGAIVSDFNTALLKKEDDPLWNDNRYRLSFGTLSEDDYNVLLDALDVAGKVSQFPQSPVAVTLGVPVSVSFQKQDIRVDLLLSRLKTGGLSLHIVPHIAIAATELFNGRMVPASVPLWAQTDIPVADNTTIVIGGFMKEEEIKRTHKLPWLGSIPIVGLVFRSHGHLMQKTETVVFLTMLTHAVETSQEDIP